MSTLCNPTNTLLGSCTVSLCVWEGKEGGGGAGHGTGRVLGGGLEGVAGVHGKHRLQKCASG